MKCLKGTDDIVKNNNDIIKNNNDTIDNQDDIIENDDDIIVQYTLMKMMVLLKMIMTSTYNELHTMIYNDKL